MKHRLSARYLSLLMALIMMFSLFPTTVFAAGSSVDVEIIVASYVDDEWEILYPEGESAAVTITSEDGTPTLTDAINQLDSDAEISPYQMDSFFDLESDWVGFSDIWWCFIDDSEEFDYGTELEVGNKIIFAYYDMMEADDPDWDELSALLSDGADPGTPQPNTITVSVIAAIESYDGWVILYPETAEDTQVTVSYEGDNPTALDVVMALDSSVNAGNLTSNRPTTFLGYARNSNGYANWTARKLSGGSYSNMNNYTTSTVSDNDSVIIYLPFASGSVGAPTWVSLEPLITTPNPVYTPEQRLSNLLAAELAFDKIKGTNIAADNITANLSSLPGYLDGSSTSFANVRLSWTSSNTMYMSNSGTLQLRPKPGEAPVEITMTANAIIGGSYVAAKYGDNPNLPQDITINLTIQPFTELELEGKTAEKADVEQAMADFAFRYLSNESCEADNILRNIWLNTSSLGGVSGVNAVWTSSDTNVIRINSAQGLVTRPAVGESDATVMLTVTAYKNQYSDSKTFTVKVPAVTQTELDAANAELDAVAAALTFNVIKNANASAEAVRTGLQMVYRGLSYPAEITWGGNSGYEGVEITWATSDSAVIASYGTVTRPTADKSAVLTATLKLFHLEAHVEPRTVEIPIIVRKLSHSANVASITASPSMGLVFNATTKSYNLTAPAIADSVTVTVTTEESGTLITSGGNSGYGVLTFGTPLTAGPDVITINTTGLDTSTNTDSYTLNITRATPQGNDAAVSDLLEALSAHYAGTEDDWAAMSMAAYGSPGAAAGKTIVENAREAFINGGTTDIQRKIIALTALGVDAADVYAGDLFVDDYLNFVAKVGANYSVLQATEAIFGLIALDSGEYDDSGLTLGREEYIDYLLTNKLTPAAGQAAWSIAAGNTTPNIDVTAMALAALASYYLDSTLYPAKSAEITTAVNGAVAYLSALQNNLGHYENSNSTAMVIIGIAALGIDPDSGTGDFAKNGNSLIDGLLEFKTSSNRFGYDDNMTVSAMSTEQAFRALLAYRGFRYLNNNAYNVYYFGAQSGDGTELTGENNPDNEAPDPSAPKSIRVRVENLKTGETLIPETEVSLAGTHLAALKAALEENGYNPDTALSGSSFITSILGVSSGAQTGWMYTLNGVVPSTMLTETMVAQGDVLVMFYLDYGAAYNEAFYVTKLDSTSKSISAGESITFTLTGSLVDIWSMAENPYEPMVGAKVYAYNSSGSTVAEGITAADGTATLTFADAGSYTVSAIREGANNANDLVPPLCAVTVSNATNPGTNPGGNFTVYFTLKGLNSSNNEETWINRKSLTNIEAGTSVSDVIIKALGGTGYTQVGAAGGYVKSVTTPDGITLSEKQAGMPNSGWIYSVNSQFPTRGMEAYIVKSGDHIVLSFTKDYTQEPGLSNRPGDDSGVVETWVNPFADVNESDWFYGDVEYAVTNGLFNGTSDNGFSPNAPMTRGMMVTVLWRMAGEPAAKVENPFSDLTQDWYRNAVIWAAENNIVQGYGGGYFRPDDNITRQDAAVILARHMEYAEIEVSVTQEYREFGDEDRISDYAKSAIQLMNKLEIVNGIGNNFIDPTGNATRAQVAAMLRRFIEKVVG